jgi:hypothetical protein
MKIRTCDKCKKEIPSKITYYKMYKIVRSGEKLQIIKQVHVGDICIECVKLEQCK